MSEGAEMKECDKVKNFELIDGYIQGKLSEADREAFERHYFECDPCFEELQFREKLLGVTRDHGETIFADYITKRKHIREPLGPRILDRLFPGIPTWRQGWIYAAVSVAVILIMIPILSTLFAPNKYEHLSDIKPYPYLFAGLRSGGSEGERLFQQGMRHYTDGEYDQSSRYLEKVVTIDSKSALAQFYLGICFLMMDKTGMAVQSLERAVAAQPDSEIFHWYLGQAFLKEGDGERARVEFEKVRDLNGDFQTRAKTLIRKMGEIE